jgi:hypothetical protein
VGSGVSLSVGETAGSGVSSSAGSGVSLSSSRCRMKDSLQSHISRIVFALSWQNSDDT